MNAAPAAQACGTLAPILHRKIRLCALEGGVELRQLVLPEIAGGPVDVARDPRRLRAEPAVWPRAALYGRIDSEVLLHRTENNSGSRRVAGRCGRSKRASCRLTA